MGSNPTPSAFCSAVRARELTLTIVKTTEHADVYSQGAGMSRDDEGRGGLRTPGYAQEELHHVTTGTEQAEAKAEPGI